MQDRSQQRQQRKAREEQFDERYVGLSRAEVALRERQAKKFGRKAQHLGVSTKPEEESKTPLQHTPLQQSHEIHMPAAMVNEQQMRGDPSAKLRQLQMDNERYRASIENSTQKLQAQIGETSQASQAYQFKYMQQPSSVQLKSGGMGSTSAAASMQSQKQHSSEAVVDQLAQQNSTVGEASTNDNDRSSSAQQPNGARKNLELLRTILQDYSPEELESEIFTLNEVTALSQKQQNKQSSSSAAKKSSKSQMSQTALIRSQTQAQGQPAGAQQIVLNEKQFNLIKKVYPQAFQAQQMVGQSPQCFSMGPTNNTPQFSLKDPQLIIQFFANMKALYRRM